MFRKFLGSCTLFSASVILAFVIHFANSIEGNLLNVSSTTVANNLTQKPQECLRRHPDGITYKGPCVNLSTDPGNKANSSKNESEVKDLLSRTSTVKPSEDLPNNFSIGQANIDTLITPKSKLSTNSRFNLTAAGTAALTCLTIAVVFYAGVMIWKKMMMSGYNNREILLNDDDIGDINDEDMRHFEAACIQIQT